MPRGRSSSAHRKVLDAATELMAERGIDAASMDAIAALSGVSKATIYKHWADKEALLLEVLADLHSLHARPKFDSGRTQADMVAVLSYKPAERVDVREKIMPHLMAYCGRNPTFGNTWRNMVMEPPRNELKHLFTLGIKKRELRPDLDFELALSLLLGPILYQYLLSRKQGVEPRPIAEGVVAAFWRAFGAGGKTEAVRSIKSLPG